MSQIPLVDLCAQYHSLQGEIDRAIHSVLERGQFILGPEVEALEREVAAYCGVGYAVAVASGTDALEFALRACGIGRGDEVITTAYSFFATAEAILAVGASPVFVDIELSTYTLDPGQLATKLSPRTKAVLPVHLFGHPCDMPAIQEFTRRHQLSVIEDCAQAIGARFHGQRVGSFGRAAALSFYPSKNLGAYGDGGMVLTSEATIAETIRLLRDHGSRTKYHHETTGRNSRLDELQAAVLRVKLRHLDRWNQARRQLAQRYNELMAAGHVEGLVGPQESPGCDHVYHLYTIRVARRDQVKDALERQGIAAPVYYPSILPNQPALAGSRTSHAMYPQAEEASKTVLSLPLYPELPVEHVERIVRTLAQAMKSSPRPAEQPAS